MAVRGRGGIGVEAARCYGRRAVRLLSVVIAVACGALTASGPVWASSEGAAPCIDRAGVDCLEVSVPLDRARPGGQRLSLHVERWTAPAARGVAVILAGGPGQAATRVYDVGAAALHDLLPGYTLVAFDARGTGRSGLLRCPELESPDVAVATPLRACADRLGPGRRFYTTAETAADLEAVRSTLGAGRVLLWGTSYGTKVALDYARRYP